MQPIFHCSFSWIWCCLPLPVMLDCGRLLDTCQTPRPAAALLPGPGGRTRPSALGPENISFRTLGEVGWGEGAVESAEVSPLWRREDLQWPGKPWPTVRVVAGGPLFVPEPQVQPRPTCIYTAGASTQATITGNSSGSLVPFTSGTVLCAEHLFICSLIHSFTHSIVTLGKLPMGERLCARWCPCKKIQRNFYLNNTNSPNYSSDLLRTCYETNN